MTGDGRPAPRTIASVDALLPLVGTHLGFSDWHVLSMDSVERFADLTGDRQWIHVDVERARRGPFGGPIVHGFLTLALLPALKAEIFAITGAGALVNYGLDRVRFPHPLPVGARVRAGAELLRVEPAAAGTRAVFRFTFFGEGVATPVCVADSISLIVGEARSHPAQDG